MSSAFSKPVDVAVVGAGPAGSATARRLSQYGCRVALIERTRFTDPRVGESLAPAVQPLLNELGVWARFLALGPLPSWGTRSLWGSASPQEHSHIANPYGCGWHVDRLAFDRMLAEAAVAAGAKLLTGTAMIGCEAMPGGSWRLHIKQRGDEDAPEQIRTLDAGIVIDATGRPASVARRLGGQRLVFDRLIGVTTQFAGLDASQEGYILVETASDGWWYSAPVPGRRMIAMLMTDADVCGRAGMANVEAWRMRLQRAPATQTRVAGSAAVWGPRAYSAISQRLRRNGAHARWLAVGDAALAVDPISGSGVVRALRTAQAGADVALQLFAGMPAERIAAYETERDHECSKYLSERAAYYAIERRWSNALFWRRRVPNRTLTSTHPAPPADYEALFKTSSESSAVTARSDVSSTARMSPGSARLGSTPAEWIR